MDLLASSPNPKFCSQPILDFGFWILELPLNQRTFQTVTCHLLPVTCYSRQKIWINSVMYDAILK